MQIPLQVWPSTDALREIAAHGLARATARVPSEVQNEILK